MPPRQEAHPQKKEFPLKIDVLNYSPAPYQFPRAWVDFLSSIEGRMKEVLAQTSPDDLNDDMFDFLIEAAAREARTSALRQRTEHLHMIRHDNKVLLGELAEAQALRQDLDGALDEVLQQLSGYGTHSAAKNDYKEVP